MSYRTLPIKQNGTVVLDDAAQVDFTGLATVTDGGNKEAVVDVSAGINDLTDVTVTTPTNGQALYYNSVSGQWENTTLLVPGQGKLLQVQFGPIPAVQGTATIPKDATAPLVTEGVPIWTQAITPASAGSKIRISTSVSFAVSNAASELVVAIFRDSTCVGVMVDTAANKDSMQTVTFTVYDLPNTTTPLTYSARVGRSGGNATWYINQDPTIVNVFTGLLANNAYTVEEIAV